MAYRKVGKAFVRLWYNKFARDYFHEDDLPDFDSLDFEFVVVPGDCASVQWDENGIPSLSIDPVFRSYPYLLRSVILHELGHLKLGPRVGHGKKFYAEMLRVCLMGGIRVLV